jgi:hypothetical protein
VGGVGGGREWVLLGLLLKTNDELCGHGDGAIIFMSASAVVFTQQFQGAVADRRISARGGDLPARREDARVARSRGLRETVGGVVNVGTLVEVFAVLNRAAEDVFIDIPRRLCFRACFTDQCDVLHLVMN